MRNYFGLNENENITFQNVWVVPTARLRGNLIGLNDYVRKEERYQISLHLKELEQEEHN